MWKKWNNDTWIHLSTGISLELAIDYSVILTIPGGDPLEQGFDTKEQALEFIEYFTAPEDYDTVELNERTADEILADALEKAERNGSETGT